MPRKNFPAFTRLDASDVNSFLMDQTVMRFAGTAARSSAIPAPVDGMVTTDEVNKNLQTYYTSWRPLPFAVAAGAATATFSASSSSSGSITFPASRFTQGPVIVGNINTAAAASIGSILRFSSITASGANFTLTVNSSFTGSVSFNWFAIQMSNPNTAG
jgi:hypothetical protein